MAHLIRVGQRRANLLHVFAGSIQGRFKFVLGKYSSCLTPPRPSRSCPTCSYLPCPPYLSPVLLPPCSPHNCLPLLHPTFFLYFVRYNSITYSFIHLYMYTLLFVFTYLVISFYVYQHSHLHIYLSSQFGHVFISYIYFPHDTVTCHIYQTCSSTF